MLEEALEGLGPESGDGHVRDLAGRVRGLLSEGRGEGVGIAGRAVDKEGERVRSGEGGKPVEEAEKAL